MGSARTARSSRYCLSQRPRLETSWHQQSLSTANRIAVIDDVPEDLYTYISLGKGSEADHSQAANASQVPSKTTCGSVIRQSSAGARLPTPGCSHFPGPRFPEHSSHR